MDQHNPDSLRNSTTNPSGAAPLRDRAVGVIAFATVLGLLYVGRDVLIPLTVALMLSSYSSSDPSTCCSYTSLTLMVAGSFYDNVLLRVLVAVAIMPVECPH